MLSSDVAATTVACAVNNSREKEYYLKKKPEKLTLRIRSTAKSRGKTTLPGGGGALGFYYGYGWFVYSAPLDARPKTNKSPASHRSGIYIISYARRIITAGLYYVSHVPAGRNDCENVFI